MPITALPTPPQRSDSANFASRGDAFMAALPTFQSEANTLETNVNAKEATATAAAATATTQAGLASTSASNASTSASTATTKAAEAAASALAAMGSAAFVDSNPVVKGSADATKQMRFEVDGFTTATTRVVTVPNKDGTMAMTSDFAAPGPIGSTTPSTGAFTALSATGNLAVNTASAVSLGSNVATVDIANSAGGGIRFRTSSAGNSGYLQAVATGVDFGTTDALPIRLVTNATTQATLDASGNLGLGVTPTGGINACLQIKDGIKFPSTQVPSSDPNTLDDYEEGTWTPTIAGSTVAGSGTYTAQTGRYTKKGREVTCLATIGWSAHTGTGNMLLTGLPFTAEAGINPQSSASCATLTITGQLFLEVGQSTAGGTFFVVNNGALSSLAMDSAASVYLQFTYNV